MGGWKLEVLKMALYMSFPVGMFHYFNQPDLFEKWVVKTRRELFPPENMTHKDEIIDCIQKLQEKQELEMLRLLEGGQKT
uniref:Protein PET100 homolog, mitochondrial n=2 Tax=Timema TaxID=61471 RepID=A0A7R9F1V2_9NEOP|nr:unnamed protein product [Timema bartmani]